MSVSMAVLAGTNYALTNNNNQNAGYTQAAFLFIFNTFFALGWLGMTWLYPAEIVYASPTPTIVFGVSNIHIGRPLRIRAPTAALATSANWIL